nr:FHA domain-containing protein [Pyxidicoccus fallax]
MSVQELRSLAATLPSTTFKQQLGPFALVQRPPSESASAVLAPTRMATSEEIQQGMLSLLFEFEQLRVATLPPLAATDRLRIGRRMDCDLVIDDASVSKMHAELRWDASQQRCTVQDLGSTNGTFLNAQTLGGREATLRDGDILSFGNVQFWYLLAETLHERLRAGEATGMGSRSG